MFTVVLSKVWKHLMVTFLWAFLLFAYNAAVLTVIVVPAGCRPHRGLEAPSVSSWSSWSLKFMVLNSNNGFKHPPSLYVTPQLGNYNSFEGVLYCRPHFDQLFKRTGSLDKSFEGTPKVVKPEKTVDPEVTNKVSSAFVGTKDKCFGCNKTVYPIESVTVNGTSYHRGCFKCCHGGCTISPSNFIAHEGRLYCKHHHIQLFKEKGNYSQLEADHDQPATAGAVEA